MRTLDDIMGATNWNVLKNLKGWLVTRKGDVVTIEMSAKDSQRYHIALLCNRYPMEAPSVAFVNSQGNKMDRSAWPMGRGLLADILKHPPQAFLCTELTREGLAHHAEWKGLQTAWNGDHHTIIDVFNLIQRLLNSDGYTGRAV